MKTWNYVVITLGMLLFLHIAGVDVGISSNIFERIGMNFNEHRELTNVTLTAGSMYGDLFQDYGATANYGILATLVLAVGGYIYIGTKFGMTAENVIILPFIVTSLVLFVSAMVSIMNMALQADQWVGMVIALLMAPLGVGLIVSLVEFFRGTD
jgi:hypothetical protein